MELKLCPFCGNLPEYNKTMCVCRNSECPICGVWIKLFFWNRRSVVPDKQEGECELLKEFLDIWANYASMESLRLFALKVREKLKPQSGNQEGG